MKIFPRLLLTFAAKRQLKLPSSYRAIRDVWSNRLFEAEGGAPGCSSGGLSSGVPLILGFFHSTSADSWVPGEYPGSPPIFFSVLEFAAPKCLVAFPPDRALVAASRMLTAKSEQMELWSIRSCNCYETVGFQWKPTVS